MATHAFRDQKARTDRLSNFDKLLHCHRLSDHSTPQLSGLSHLGIPRDFVGLHTECQNVTRTVAHGTDKTAEGASSTSQLA